MPSDRHKTAVWNDCRPAGQHRHEVTCGIRDMLPDIFHHLGVDDKMVHLVHTAALLFVLLVLRMLVVQVTVLCTLLKDHTYPLVVMVVQHYGGEQHGKRCRPKMEYVQSFLHKSVCKSKQKKAKKRIFYILFGVLTIKS